MQIELINQPRSTVFTEEFRERHDRMTMIVRMLRTLKVKVLTTDALNHERPLIEVSAENAQQLTTGIPKLMLVTEADGRVRHSVRLQDVDIVWISKERMDLRPQLLISGAAH